MSSNVEMDDSSQSETEIEPELAIVPDVLTARKPALPILFTRASTMIGGRMRIITGLILSPRSSGSLVTNMKKEAILALRNLQEPHLPSSVSYGVIPVLARCVVLTFDGPVEARS
jgi:hypothetical protein